jgi:N6-adenosine-specific RNA methylase IME4
MEQKKYKIIYADPPWSYNDKMGNDSHFMSATSAYQTQDKEWIKNLKVNDISDKDCVLFLWAVSPLLPEALEVMKSWGFKYVTVAFVWSKHTKNKIKVSNMGRWTMGNVEVCLLGRKGKPQRIVKNIKQLVEAERTEHSKKPTEVRDRIIQLMGDLPRLEMFARQKTEGWDVFGNEVSDSIVI